MQLVYKIIQLCNFANLCFNLFLPVVRQGFINNFMQFQNSNASMVIKTQLLFFIFMMLLSCNNEADTKAENNIQVEDSAQAANSIAAEDSITVFQNKADDWITQSLKTNTSNWSRFHLTEFWYDDSLQQSPYKPDAAFFSDYAPLLKWSPDSSYVLDMGTIGATLIKDKTGKTHIGDGDVDTEIALMNRKTNTRSRILFFGSSSAVIDVRWLNTTQIAILGTEAINEPADTLLWVINANENYFRKYKWK